MKITLVPSSVTERTRDQHQYLTTFLINDNIAIDAGCLGLMGTAQDQARIQHVFLTHAHIDHIGSLPVFVENVYEEGSYSVTIHGSGHLLQCLKQDIFNDRVWPDFVSLSRPEDPFLKLALLEPGRTVEVEGVRITPVPVDHVVPTFGFLIEDERAAVAIVTDTGPSDAIWERANALPKLKAVFLEATFPEALSWLAEASKHLTPSKFAGEVQKLARPATIYAIHLKARFRAEIIKELKALRLADLKIAQFGRPYSF